jgi:hypothetical protein
LNAREARSVLYWAGCLLAAPLLILAATPAAAQSIPAVKDADWCRAFDPKTEDPACVNPVSRKPPVPIRPGLYLTPPLEYDHPYSGELITAEVDSEDKVRELCPGVKFNPKIGALACAHLGKNSNQGKCWIIIANDELITSLGQIPDLVRSHEIAHCNGWPADHRGALPFIGAVRNAASQFDGFAFSAVRKTVAEVASDLDRTAAGCRHRHLSVRRSVEAGAQYRVADFDKAPSGESCRRRSQLGSRPQRKTRT